MDRKKVRAHGKGLCARMWDVTCSVAVTVRDTVHPRTFHSLPHPCSSALKIPLEKILEYNSCSALYSCDHLPWLASLTALGCSPVVILYRLIGSAYGC